MLTATRTTLRNGTTGIRVDGHCGVGVSVQLDGAEVRVGSILWQGIASDGRPATLVTLAQPRTRPAYRPVSRRSMGARKMYEQTGDYYGSGMADEE